MKNELLFDFTVDKPAKTIYITREFEAGLDLVWDAFTTQELLDQWTAPAPFKARTKYMNFVEGGKRFYAMVSPEGVERWALQEYTTISPKTNFKMLNTFSDENENKDAHGSAWDYQFSEEEGITKVRITIFNESFDRMESLLEGFRAGFTMTLKNLEELLAGMAKK